jgi:hypothetical protein
MVWLLVVETPRASGTERSLGPAKLVAERRQLEAGGPPLLTGADGVVRHRRVFSSGELRRGAGILHRYRSGGDGKLIGLRGDSRRRVLRASRSGDASRDRETPSSLRFAHVLVAVVLEALVQTPRDGKGPTDAFRRRLVSVLVMRATSSGGTGMPA